jgi:hypothetical protein
MRPYSIRTNAPKDKVLFACHDSFVGSGQFFKRKMFGLFGMFNSVQLPGADLAFADVLGVSNRFIIRVTERNGETVVEFSSAAESAGHGWQNSMKNSGRMKDQLRNRVRWVKRSLRSQGFVATVSRV